MIRWYEPRDDKAVREVFALCHPDWPERAKDWFHVHPTLVYIPMISVVGFASFTLNYTPEGVFGMYHDLCVNPDWQGRGFGAELFVMREAMARAHGATRFLGTTKPENDAMTHLLVSQGYAATAPNEYGVVWMKED